MIGLYASLFAATASAQQPEPQRVEADAVEEIVVWGDLFARWDDTRWMVTTEITTPLGMLFTRDENDEFASRQFQIRTVFACNKDWKLGPNRYEVSCKIEDFAMLAAVSERTVTEKDIARAQRVLDEIDAKLTGATLQLQVAHDGRVNNLALEGVPKANRRQSEMHETLRQVLSRVIVGFDLKLRKYNQLNEGKWHEYNTKLMSMPVPPSIPASQGSSLVVHYINPYKGHTIVQSIGKGLVNLEIGGVTMNFSLELIGVSTFDDREGYMLERVWALKGKNTGTNAFDRGEYFNAGRIWNLGEQDKPDCGPTQVINGSNQEVEGLPAWKSIEDT